MTKALLIEWLRGQSATLDGIIAKAGRSFCEDAFKSRPAGEFGFDLAECQQESWNLINDKDLCYDRPNTPLVYSLWYHGRRVNTFLSHFTEALWEAQDQPSIELFDLGAGTGAVQWSVGLVYHKMKESGLQPPKIRIINVDTSPFMLRYSRNYLWKYFTEAYPFAAELSENIEYDVNSWSNEKRFDISNPWITASYLFDISDVSESGEYRRAVMENFQGIIETYKPFKILLITAKEKEKLLDEVTRDFPENEYVIQKIKAPMLLLSGYLDSTNILRAELYGRCEQYLSTTMEKKSLKNRAYWGDPSFIGCSISVKQQEIFGREPTKEGVKIHTTSIKVRHEVILNEDQEHAAQNMDNPVVIMGPAGCGKSIVLTDRIKNIVEKYDYDPDLTILLTTFNKDLLGQLNYWLLDILDKTRVAKTIPDSGGFKIYFTGNTSENENIRVLHFDMLPSRLGNVRDNGLVNLDKHKSILDGLCAQIKRKNQITTDQYDNILNPAFLLEEYTRVIYGMQVPIQNSKEEYLNVKRRGRGVALNKERRELVWQCLVLYEKKIDTESIPSFTNRKQRFLNKLKGGQIDLKYDFVVVDEFQDCTKAEFEIFFNLLKSPNCLVIAGDLSQSVQLGKSANVRIIREAIRTDREVSDISWHHLKGSYRLPFRICEAIRKISEHIHQSFGNDPAAEIIAPYKGSPPGARPIIVFAKNENEMAAKIARVLKQYEVYELDTKCILEEDDALMRVINIAGGSVLKLKGMEKHCVIWSTRKGIPAEKERFEFVHTILSRTSSILIIALFDGEKPEDHTQEIFKDAIGLLVEDRLIFWDKETRDRFAFFCHVPDLEEFIED